MNESEDYVVPYDAELECRQYVIVYDEDSNSVKEDGDAVSCAKVMWDMGSRNPVRVLSGGYRDFSALYPFLRTQKIIYMPRELDELKTYPTEVIPGLLYLGNWRHGTSAYIQKDLKIKFHVTCAVETEGCLKDPGQVMLQVSIEDEPEADLYSKLAGVCAFIDQYEANNACILVFSKLGISRSTAICIAYLMHHLKITLKLAYKRILKCCTATRPNRGFIMQLSQFEKDIFGEEKTDVSDPKF